VGCGRGFGEGRTLAPAHAALLNGALTHSLDFDDTHRDGSVHPGAAVISVVLGLAEQHGTGGRRAIAAAALLRGRLTWSGYDLVGDAGAAALARRVTAEANALFPERRLGAVEVVTSRGTFSDRRWVTRGEPERPSGACPSASSFPLVSQDRGGRSGDRRGR
jgi:2-methylcitrate dehydratase PrpD